MFGVGIGDLIKSIKIPALPLNPPAFQGLDLDVPANVRLPEVVRTQNAWFFDGRAATSPHFDKEFPAPAEEALRADIADTKAKASVVTQVVDVRKPEYMLILPDDHKQAGLHLQESSIIPHDWFSDGFATSADNSCHLQ